MPATKKKGSTKRVQAASGGKRAAAPQVLKPRDPRTDVKIAGDWLSRWLPELDEVELKTYLEIAHFYNARTYHAAKELEAVFGTGKRSGKNLDTVLERLEKLGLLEVIRHEGKFHYHFPHRDVDGFHRGVRARPSIAEALAFQQRMTEELCDLTSQDETAEARETFFKKYPPLREEYELFKKGDPDAPAWRLWMEVSRYLIHEFESRFGSLKEDHGEIFKSSAAVVLRHHLDVVDGVTKEVIRNVPKIFTNANDRWAVAPTEHEFTSHAIIRKLAARYNVGATEIFANTLEALGHWGLTVVETDHQGKFLSLVLPSTTGLTKSEARVLFLRPEERDSGEDSPRTRERVRRARNKYANHMIHCGLTTLLDFFHGDKVKDLDAALQTITDKVNEALSLLPASEVEDALVDPVTLEHVIDRFDALRKG
jgi:hypothetical protein